MTRRMSAASATLRVMGPAWSIDHASGSTPARLTRPYVGLMPLIPQSEAGVRVEPPRFQPAAPGARGAPNPHPRPSDDPTPWWMGPASPGFAAPPLLAIL